MAKKEESPIWKYRELFKKRTIAQKKLLEKIKFMSKYPQVETFEEPKEPNPFDKPDMEDEERILDDIIEDQDVICLGCKKPVSFTIVKNKPTFVLTKAGYMHASCKKKLEKKYKNYKKKRIYH